ncbi:hypothetical protein [Endothiovibrio diazotrophicus]
MSNEISHKTLSRLIGRDVESIEENLLRHVAAGFLERIDDDIFRFSHEYIRSAANEWFASHSEGVSLCQMAAKKCTDDNYKNAMISAKINGYIGRSSSAINSYNYAIQYSGDDYAKRLPCLRGILEILQRKNDDGSLLSYHSCLVEITRIGYYLVSQKNLYKLNKRGLNHIKSKESKVDPEIYIEYKRKYTHSLSHLSIRSASRRGYAHWAKKSIQCTRSKLELSQALNRLVSAASLFGEWEVGSRAGILAEKLQTPDVVMDDPAINNVLRGEMAIMYAHTRPEISEKICNTMINEPGCARQRCHDLIVAATVALTLNDLNLSRVYLDEADKLIDRGSFNNIKISTGLLRGTLKMKEGNFVGAGDAFRRWALEAAWRDNIREQIRSINNYIVAKFAAGNPFGETAAIERLAWIHSSICKEMGESSLISIYDEALGASDTYCVRKTDSNVFPIVTDEGTGSMLMVIGKNIDKLCSALKKGTELLAVDVHRGLDNGYCKEAPCTCYPVNINSLGIDLYAIC